jgi:hypothetical protein
MPKAAKALKRCQKGTSGLYQEAQFEGLSAGGTIRLWRLGHTTGPHKPFASKFV